MKWFKHMTDAHDGKDLTKVRIRYGADGYAIYWYCLELIAADLGASDKITFELRHDAEVIGHNLKIDSARVEEIMRFLIALELFEQSSGTITCLKLAKYLDKKSTRNITIHKIIDSASLLSGTKPDVPGLSGLDRDTEVKNITDAARPKHEYTREFEFAWKHYPNRAGGNPKPKAFKAWNARIKQGVKVSDMADGVVRYAAYCGSAGKLNTEYVMQAATFFGPDNCYAESWVVTDKGAFHATRQPVDNSAIGQVRAANQRARDAERRTDATSVGTDDHDVRPPLEG